MSGRHLPASLARPKDPRLCDALFADPDDPVVGEFVRREVLCGTVRTAPAGRGRVVIFAPRSWYVGAPGSPP